MTLDPYVPCDVPRQSGGSTQIPSLTEGRPLVAHNTIHKETTVFNNVHGSGAVLSPASKTDTTHIRSLFFCFLACPFFHSLPFAFFFLCTCSANWGHMSSFVFVFWASSNNCVVQAVWAKQMRMLCADRGRERMDDGDPLERPPETDSAQAHVRACWQAVAPCVLLWGARWSRYADSASRFGEGRRGWKRYVAVLKEAHRRQVAHWYYAQWFCS